MMGSWEQMLQYQYRTSGAIIISYKIMPVQLNTNLCAYHTTVQKRVITRRKYAESLKLLTLTQTRENRLFLAIIFIHPCLLRQRNWLPNLFYITYPRAQQPQIKHYLIILEDWTRITLYPCTVSYLCMTYLLQHLVDFIIHIVWREYSHNLHYVVMRTQEAY